MAEQSLTPENLESYSTEAISNFSKAIEDFADVLTEIKAEDANIAVFNSIHVMIDGRKRRLADIGNIEAPNDPLNLEVMVYSRDNWDLAAARASSVVQSISKSGDIPLDRLMAISYGEAKPLASNKNADGRSKNRRIGIEIKY